MATDIFDVDSIDSLLRGPFNGEATVNLSELNIPVYEVTRGYKTAEFSFSECKEDYPEQIRQAIAPIVAEAEKLGYNANIFTALYEAVLNAHQHGNKMDSEKSVKIAYKINEKTLDIAVIDEGGEMEIAFIPFVMRHRLGKHKCNGGIVDFYEFARKEKPSTNNGTGTTFMHLYLDKVEYFKSENNGLVVHLSRANPNPLN